MTDRRDIRRAGSRGRAKTEFIESVRSILATSGLDGFQKEVRIRAALEHLDRRRSNPDGRK